MGDIKRADNIVKWALRSNRGTGRSAFDSRFTSGMRSSDKTWLRKNPDWKKYIGDEIGRGRELKQKEKEQKQKEKEKKVKGKAPVKTVKKKRCPKGTRRNKVSGLCEGSGVSQPQANPKKNTGKKTLKPCKAGQERNPKTNRCRKIPKKKK